MLNHFFRRLKRLGSPEGFGVLLEAFSGAVKGT